mmetsp:Transcript_41661/g.43639  ORF Transcript_41661/g.43639 Transcript_41661/m.43639 type:complete len:158 (+) Transcript_41661:2-475(+)
MYIGNDTSKGMDYKRILKQASFGIAIVPFLHLQYSIVMPKLFPPPITNIKLFKSVAYDQTVTSSVFLFSFFSYLDYFNGLSMQESLNNTIVKFPSTMIANWKIWPFIQAVNLYFVPVAFRVLVVNVVGIGWNIYLSYVQNVKGKLLVEKQMKSKVTI